MPYIQCKDGKTYSRYDQRPYVKQCIYEQKAEQQAAYRACTEDPTCLAEREARKEHSHHIMIGFGIIAVLIFIAGIWTIIDRTK